MGGIDGSAASQIVGSSLRFCTLYVLVVSRAIFREYGFPFALEYQESPRGLVGRRRLEPRPGGYLDKCYCGSTEYSVFTGTRRTHNRTFSPV